MIWRAFLTVRRQPIQRHLPRWLQKRERDARTVRCEGHVDGEEVAAGLEAVGGFVGNVGIEDGDGYEARAFVEDLDAQAGGLFRDGCVDDGAGGDLATAKAERDIGCRTEVREEIGDEVELRYSLDLYFLVVFGPFALREVAVYGAVHVAW